MLHRLQAVHIHKKKSNHRTGKHISNQHLHAVADDLFIIDKHPDHGLSAGIIQDHRRDSHNQAASFREPFHRLKAFHIPRSVIITQQGLHAVGQADAADFHKNSVPAPEIFRAEGQKSGLLQKIPQKIETGQYVSNGRGNRRARSSHTKDGDENRVQHNIGYGSDHTSNHGFPARSLHADHKAAGCRPDDKRSPVGNMERISPGKFIGLSVGSKQGQNRLHEDHKNQHKHNSHDQRRIQHEGRHVSGPFFILLAQSHGSHRASSHSKHVCKGHHQNKYGIGETHRRHLKSVSRLSHKEGIGHIINHRHQTADDAGYGHLCHSLRHLHPPHQFIVFHLFHSSIPDFSASALPAPGTLPFLPPRFPAASVSPSLLFLPEGPPGFRPPSA